MKAIEIINAKKTYRPKGKKGQVVNAVSDVSLDIEEGEIFGLLGANGAGKTTLIKLMLGLAKCDSGTIYVEGYDISKSREKALMNIGALVEDPSLFVDFTGFENLKYYAKLQGVEISREKIMDIVRLVGLEDRIDSKFKTYSLGMKQRLGIAQALLHTPKILVLDEPTNGLDPNGILQMRELFINLKNQLGVTIVISSHILSEMQQLCDRVAFMAEGEVKAVKTMQEVNYGVDKLKKYAIECSNLDKAKAIVEDYGVSCQIQNSYLVLKAGDSEIAQIIRLLVNGNIDVYTVTRQKRRLEDLYKEVSK